MFERVISQVVNRFLGEYIEGLDHDQLKIHLLRGELKLENLTIKGKELNEKLKVPVEIVFGHIGLLHVTWDWLSLRTKPVTVILSDVNILLKDKPLQAAILQGKLRLSDQAQAESKEREAAEKDPKKAAEQAKAKDPREKELQAKMDKLAAVEEMRLTPDAEKDAGFVAKMVQGVLANLRVLVRHIHIRYEHKLDPRNPCAVGITLEEMRLSSTGPDWQKVHFVKHDQEHAHKLIELTRFGVYCCHNQVIWPPTPETMRQVFGHQVVKKEKGQEQEEKSTKDEIDCKEVDPLTTVPSQTVGTSWSTYEYLLQMDGVIRAQINRLQAARGPDEPLASIQALFPMVDVTLRRRQYLALLGLAKDLGEIAQKMHFAPTEEEAKEKAEEAKEEAQRKEMFPDERVGTVEDRERYIYLYKRTLSASWLPELDDAEVEEIKQLERDIEYKSLDEWRLYALAELRAEMPMGEGANQTNAHIASSISASPAPVGGVASAAELPASAEPTSPFSTPLNAVNKAPLEKRVRTKDLGMLEKAKATLHTAAVSVGSMAKDILPGAITDKLGLTTQEGRAAAAEREAEKEEIEECEAPFKESPVYSPNGTLVQTGAASPNEHVEVLVEPVGSPMPPGTPKPKVELTDDARAAIRVAALQAEKMAPSTRAEDALFLPTDDRTHDALNATADIAFETISLRLLDEDSSDLFRLSIEKLRAKVSQRTDTMAAQLELGRIALEDARATGYPYIISTNVGVKEGAGNQPVMATNPTAAADADQWKAVQALAPLLLLHVSRLGTAANHAIELDVELNHLQIFPLPSLLTLPAFFDPPQYLKDEAKAKQQEAKAKAEQMQRELEEKAVEAKIDSLDMADALLLGHAADPAAHPKTPLIKLPPFPIYARVRMNHPLVILSVEPAADDTRALILSWAVDVSACVGGVRPGTVQAQVGLNSLSMIESRLQLVRGQTPRDHTLIFSTTLEPGTRPIISPFHVKIHVETALSTLFQDGQAQNIAVDIAASRLDVNVGFRLYGMMMAAMKAFKPPADSSSAGSGDQSQEPLDPNRKVNKSIEDQINLKDANDEKQSAIPQDPLGPIVAAQPVVPLNFTEINANIKVVGLFLNVINDTWCTALPFFRLQVENIGLKAHRFGDSGGLCGQIHLRAEVYNHRLLAWEPVIEPWSATVGVSQCQVTHTPAASLLMASKDQLQRVDQSSNLLGQQVPVGEAALTRPLAPITSLVFSSKDQLNLNISAALLEDLADTASQLQKELRRESEGWRHVRHANLYRLENHTDLAMQVYRVDLSQLDGVNEAPTELLDLQPLSNASFDFADEISIVSRALRVQLQSTHGALPLMTVPVAREVSTKHVLQPSDGSGAMTVLVDVTWDNGVRVLSIHSAWAVSNKLTVPVIVSGDRYVEKELMPGAQMWLPLLAAPMMHTIRVKPCTAQVRDAYLQHALVDGTEKDTALGLDGEYQWSEEIVISSTLRPTKRKETGPVMLDHYACAPAGIDASSSVLSIQEEKQGESSLNFSRAPAGPRPFHFTCFHAGIDVVDNEEMMDGIEVPRTREFHASIFELRTPITLENVLATEAMIRIHSAKHDAKHAKADDSKSLRAAAVVDEIQLARGQSCPIFSADTSSDLYLSLWLPHLAAGWTKPTKLTWSGTRPSTIIARLYGENGGMLPVSIELKEVHGNLRIVLYAQYWMFDLSSLSLQVTPDRKLVLPSRRLTAAEQAANASVSKNSQAHLESISLPDKHQAIMFGFDDAKASKGRLFIRAGRHPTANGFDLGGPTSDPSDPTIEWSEWSDKVAIGAAGNQSAVSMPMGPAKSAGSYEIVVDVQAGEGPFHRTKMVKFLPRFILLNLLNSPVHIKQAGLAGDSHLTLQSTQQIIWHWPHHAEKDRHWLSVRREPDAQRSGRYRPQFSAPTEQDEWQWSGFFALDTPGDQNLMVRHVNDRSRVWYLHVEVRERNGINFIILKEHDATDLGKLKVVVPYCISNRSATETIRVRQYLDLKHYGSESSHLITSSSAVKDPKHSDEGFSWIEVPPLTDRPFCMEEPLFKPTALQVQVAIRDEQGVREWIGKEHKQLAMLDLDKFDTSHAFIDYTHLTRTDRSMRELDARLAPAAAERARANPARHRLYYFNEQDGPSQFIVFSDEPSDRWKKEQLRRRREEKLREEEKKQSGATTSTHARLTTSGPFGHKERVSAQDEAHIATLGDKVSGSTGVTQDTLGVHTEEQRAIPTGQSVVDRNILSAGHGVVEESAQSSSAGVTLAQYSDQPTSRALPFGLNPRVVKDRVRALRVRIDAVKNLRSKDKNLFVRILFGSAARETDARKRRADQSTLELHQEVVFQGPEMASMMQQSHPASPAACSCFSAGSSHDCQHVFIDLYERHTLTSDSIIGSTSISLTNITDECIPRWYELRKVKGKTSEVRGVISLACWFEMKDAPQQTAHSGNLLLAYPNSATLPSHLNPDARLSEYAQTVAGVGQSDLPPDVQAGGTYQYDNATVYASSLAAAPSAGSGEAHFQPLSSGENSDADEMERVALQMMEEAAIQQNSWSEYTIRLLDTLNLDRVASALMVDLSAGRVVCYVTAPMFRRGYSILLHDRTDGSITKTWTNQDIIVALPDQLAAERKNDAVLRLSFYYYPVDTSTVVQTKAPIRATHMLSSTAATSALDVQSSGRPLLLGTAVIPLLSIQAVKLDALSQKTERDPTAPGMDESENDIVDVASLDDASLERHRYRKRLEREKEERLTREQLRVKEWHRKWLSLGTPSQSTESAEICVSIKRKEVKMPLQQAVAREDMFAAYAPPRIRFRLHLPHIGFSLIDSQPEEVAYFALQNLRLQLHDSATSTSFKMSLDSMQLDNLLRDAVFPVVLNATSVAPKDWMPVLQVAVSRQKLPGVNIQCFPYISFLLQMMDVKISELYLYKLLDFLNDLNKRVEAQPTQRAVGEEAANEKIVYRKMSDEFTLPPSQLRSVYTKFLHLQPLAVNLTFAANPGVRSKFMGESFAGGGLLGSVLRSFVTIVGAGVGSLDSAPIRLNGKIIEHHLGSPESFVKLLMAHYIKEGIKQTYAVLGSLEILGNPVNTATTISHGVKEAFYLPAQGMMISPEAFGQGLAEGSLSLVRHTFSGLGSAVAGVFSSGGKAVAAMSMDSDFITRTSVRNAAEPDHVGQGLKLGAVSLANGIKEGVTGLVREPMHGAKEEGAKGLAKGIVRGIAGAFAKPVAGALNMVAQTSQGIANTGDYMADGPRPRLHHVRAKRWIDPLDGRVTVYDRHASEEALEVEALSAGDLKKSTVKRESRRHETDTAILHRETVDTQPMHLAHEEHRKVRDDTTDKVRAQARQRQEITQYEAPRLPNA